MKVQELIDSAQDRYLGVDELEQLEGYVGSLPDRLALYKLVRDHELSLLQTVADRTLAELPNVQESEIEQGIKNLLLVIRYCSMALLLNDEAFLEKRLLKWLEQVSAAADLRRVNEVLYKVLNQVLREQFTPAQISLFQPYITSAQVTLIY